MAGDARRAFDSHAADYEAELDRGLRLSGEGKQYFALGRLAALRRVWTAAGRAEPRCVLDYGCGIGDVTALLADCFPRAEVIGVDPSERCIERAVRDHAGPRVRFSRLDGFEPPAPPADLVHLNGVVHHVPPGDRATLFAALASATRRGGAVALFENNPWNPGTRLVMARIAFDRDANPIAAPAARSALCATGLQLLATRFLFYFPAPLARLRPLERALERVPLGAQYLVLAERPLAS